MVIIEWGRINPETSEAKLHDFLNQSIHASKRVSQGMQVSSGHIARLSNAEHDQYFAFIDRLRYTGYLDRATPLGVVVNTLYAHKFIPISAEGKVQFPAF